MAPFYQEDRQERVSVVVGVTAMEEMETWLKEDRDAETGMKGGGCKYTGNLIDLMCKWEGEEKE